MQQRISITSALLVAAALRAEARLRTRWRSADAASRICRLPATDGPEAELVGCHAGARTSPHPTLGAAQRLAIAASGSDTAIRGQRRALTPRSPAGNPGRKRNAAQQVTFMSYDALRSGGLISLVQGMVVQRCPPDLTFT